MSKQKSQTRLGESKHDPQEDDPKLGPIIKKAGEEASRRVFGENPPGPGHPPELGKCHEVWAVQKAILKKKGIDWKTPVQMNPGTMFD